MPALVCFNDQQAGNTLVEGPRLEDRTHPNIPPQVHPHDLPNLRSVLGVVLTIVRPSVEPILRSRLDLRGASGTSDDAIEQLQRCGL